MFLLGLLYLIVAVAAGTTSVVVLWPLYVVGVAVLYCLDRPRRRSVRTVLALVGIGAGLAYKLGPWHTSLHAPAVFAWFAIPLAAALLLVALAGGPRRIRARHERAAVLRRQARLDAIARTRAARAERGEQRRAARREAILRRTGLDVDVVADATRAHTRTVGAFVTRRLARNRPPRRPAGPPDLLDLDQDVAADLSKRRSEEILRLAGELDEARGQADRPRPRPRA